MALLTCKKDATGHISCTDHSNCDSFGGERGKATQKVFIGQYLGFLVFHVSHWEVKPCLFCRFLFSVHTQSAPPIESTHSHLY